VEEIFEGRKLNNKIIGIGFFIIALLWGIASLIDKK